MFPGAYQTDRKNLGVQKAPIWTTSCATLVFQANPALRGLEVEAANVDASVRTLANERAVASRRQRQQQLLLLQHAFVAFNVNLLQHLKASTLTAPKELTVAAENSGETITAKTYLSFKPRSREKVLSRKILFLRKVQIDSTLHFIVVKNSWAIRYNGWALPFYINYS